MKKRLPAVLTEAEVLVLLETPQLTQPGGIRDRAILELLYGSALRNQELCALELPRIDLAARTLHLAVAKGARPRVVPFGHQAEHWLRRYLDEVRPRWLRNPKENHLFLDRWGQKGLSRAGLTGIVRGLARGAGFKKAVTPHTLRHSCATHMLARGADLRHLQQLLGHASPSTTEHYTRVELTDLRRVLSRCHPLERRR
jgi:integrase/recombinase XerD